MRKVIGFFLIVCSVTTAQFGSNTSGGKLSYEQASYDVKFYEINLTISPEEKSIKGFVEINVDLLNDIGVLVLDLDSVYSIDSILNKNEKKLDYVFNSRELSISIPNDEKNSDKFSAKIFYNGKPRVAQRPPWDDGFTWAKTEDGHDWIGVTCQGGGADVWWPCKDHPSDEPDSVKLSFTIPENLFCASNGKLINEIDNKNGTKTFTWFVSTPINNYGISLHIAPYKKIDYDFKSISGKNIPVTIYALPENFELAKQHTPQYLDHLKFFEEFCGPYPFRTDKYAVAETPYLGMEHQTIIANGYGYKNNQFDFDYLHHHELAHEWWGNLVTAKDWSDFWIHEAIAGYMQPLYAEQLSGRESYLNYLKSFKKFSNKQAIAPYREMTTEEAYTVDMYAKGAWVIHTLRYYLGDEIFFKTLRRWAYPDPEMENITDGSQCRFATTDEMKRIAEEVSGKNLSWYWDVYFRNPELPKLLVKKSTNILELQWQLENNLPFFLPVDVEINGAVEKIEMKNGKASVKINPDDKINIDPLEWITMENIEINY